MIVDAWGRVGEGGGVISRKVGAVNPPTLSRRIMRDVAVQKVHGVVIKHGQ